jgi:nickel/cobalt transporter (NicO) family protein
MRKLVAAIVLWASGATCAEADPFNGTHVVAPPVGRGFLLPDRAVAWLAHVQMQLNDVIARAFASLHGGRSTAAIATIMAVAFVYGVVHAAAPGHGKTVVASYFVANHSRWIGGVFMGGVISVLQGATAIAIVFVLSLALHLKELQIANQGALVSSLGYAMVAAIGMMSFWRAATGRGCVHAHAPALARAAHEHALHPHGHGAEGCAADPPAAARSDFQRFLIAATGVAPCSSAIVIMLFALANGAMGIGIVAVLALSFGMAVTVSSAAILGIIGRRVLVRMGGGAAKRIESAERMLRLLGSAAIVGFACLLVVGALSQI